jgi:hypothetical protein
MQTVPILYEGVWDEEAIKSCYTGISRFGGVQEGYVVRYDGMIFKSEFQKQVAKYVRRGHVQTSEHWLYQKIVKNKLEPKEK